MKQEQKLDISFAGVTSANTGNEVVKETVKEVEAKAVEAKKEVEVELAPAPAVTPEAVEEDSYVNAVEALFSGYQAFQEGMQQMRKVQDPRHIFGKLLVVLEAFQGVIAEFKKAEYTVPADYQKGQDLLLAGIEKYEVFLVEYPETLQTKGKKNKTMRKVYSLGQMSANADQDFKKAFKAFDEATQGA